MSLLSSIFQFNTSKKHQTPNARQINARKIKQVMRRAAAQQVKTPTTFLKQRHLAGVTGYNVSPVVSRVPLQYVRGNLDNTSPWWQETEVSKPVDAEALIEENRIPETSIFRVQEETREITLLNGEKIRTVRRIYYDKEKNHRFKELFADHDGELIDYNKIPKHLMPLDGISDAEIGGDTEIVVVEGYPAAEALRSRGVNAVGVISGTFDIPSERALEPLLAAKKIKLWPDNDSAGAHLMQTVARRLHAMGAREGQIELIRWIGGPRKADAFDFVGTDDELKAVLNSARTWDPSARYSTNSILWLSPPRGSAQLRLSYKVQPPMPKLPLNGDRRGDHP